MDDLQETPRQPPLAVESPVPGQGEAAGQGVDPAFPDPPVRPEPVAATMQERGGEAGSTHTVEFTSGIVSAANIEIAGQVFNQHFEVTAGAGGTESVQLSARHFRSRTSQELELCEEELVFEIREVERLQATFEDTRILVLAGEPEAGKGSLGLLLASRLTRSLQWRGLLTCQGLGTGVQVDLEKLADDSAFSHQVVMFEDALAGESADLRAFLRTVDALRLTTLRDRLQKSSAAILFTTASASLADSERRLENLGILRTVAPPAPALLVRALHHLATRLPRQGARSEAVEAFLRDHETALARDLRTVPRVARFVHEYLVEVAAGNLSIRQALGRMDDLSQWLTADLGGDLDAQAAVLAIVLGSAVPPAAGVPWFAFDDLRRRIRDLLREEAHIPEDQPSSPPGLGRAYLERARAYVAAMPSPLSDLVRFRDERYPQRLWQALLGPARELATILVPLLGQLAVGRTPALRSIAAGALGRLGQIGPADLAVPLLRSWIRRASNQEELAGAFLQGSAASGDETYEDLCLATVRGLAYDSADKVAEAAVRSLGLLGLPDPAVPIRELCSLAQERLPIQFELLRQVAEEVTAKEDELRRQADPRQVAAVLQRLHQQGHPLLIAALVPEDRIRLLGAVQYALAGILFSQEGDPGPVLRELLGRMKAEPVRLAPLVAYLFLHRQGVVDLLDRYRWRSSAFGTETSRFLLSSRLGSRDPEALRELLERIFYTLEAFPGFFRHLLEQRFLDILRSWSREGCEVAGLRPIAARLLSTLLAAGNPALRQRMQRFLEADPELVVNGSRLRSLARDVLGGKGLDIVAEASPRPRRLPAWLGKPAGTEA